MASIGQQIDVGGICCLWVDGVRHDRPVALPIDSLRDGRCLGDLAHFLHQTPLSQRSLLLQMMDIAREQDLSATVLARAVRMATASGMKPADAIKASVRYGWSLCALEGGRPIAQTTQRDSPALAH